MREMTGGCLSAAKFDIQRTSNRLLSRCATARTVRSRLGLLSQFWLAFRKTALSVQGNLKTFHDTGDSGQPVDRNFCPECGSPIISDVAVMPDLRFIKAGTLDDTSWLDPKMHAYCDSAEPWTPIPEGSQKFGMMLA